MTSETLTCHGCGIELQSEDAEKPGYVPKAALSREEVICQRCFRLRHYNEVPDVPLSDEDFVAIANQVTKADAFIVKIVDIFDFEGSWIDMLTRSSDGQDVMIVGNKADVLPKSVNQNKVMLWMRSEAEKRGLQPKDVRLMSASKGHDVEKVARAIDQHRKDRDVYVVGCTNVGKSTFINTLLKQLTGEGDDALTTSRFPGTTLGMIGVELDDGSMLYDTPGIINPEQMAHFVGPKELEQIMPDKEMKPSIYQLNPGQTLFFGGVARLDFVEGSPSSFVCYTANDLHIHRTKTENADDLYERHRGQMLAPPGVESLETFPPLKVHEWEIREEKTDIVIPGLGWITVVNAGVKVKLHLPDGAGATLRSAII
ncbi:hypothetical protein B0H94_10763 [Salsuginibacillus halophilus]|uniref:CP-type G domain-containing protein n=1 Tax=Salsuginibacillus halophilus TaxID=517424 RepID=A0A2P8HFP2_9BACI|nr:ribosome biogenesis GTPase YqeH [Salsuginibacillus halophilus]PSL45058.1 hypothetical protein B0H94_10763 [Salsuginibacillus halophilus]